MNFKPTRNKLLVSIIIPTALWILNFVSGQFSLACFDCSAKVLQEVWIKWNLITLICSIILVIIIYVIYSLIQKK